MIGQWTNHLWQSTLFAIVAALVTLAFRKNRAHVRYWVWLSASVKFLVPFALLMSLGNSLWSAFAARQIATKLAPPDVSLMVQQIAQPFPDSLRFVPSAPLTHTAHWIPIAMLSVWICGFLGVVLVRFRGWLRIRAVMRASTPMDIQAAAAVRSSPGLLEPGVVGVLRPVLLLPEDILKHLPPSQLEAVLAHEQSHIRRRDNLTAAIHMVVEAVFWFHPFVWWIGARLVEERVRACDEAVLTLGGEPRDYADAIVSVCKLYVESPLTCVSGISSADLKKRIVRIMACHVGLSMSFGRKLLLGAAGLLAVAAPVVAGWAQVQPPTAGGLGAGMPQTDGQIPSDSSGSQVAPGRPQFEVASVKQVVDDNDRLSMIIRETILRNSRPGEIPMMSPDRIRLENWALLDLIAAAYSVRADQVSGPAWLSDRSFDIEATVPVGTAKEKLNPMLQSLLEDRFDLKVHRVTKTVQGFALIVDKGGPKLKPAAPRTAPEEGLTAEEQEARLRQKLRAGIAAMLQENLADAPHLAGFESESWPSITTQEFASQLVRFTKAPVIDETGLTGEYAITIEISNDPGVSEGAVFDAVRKTGLRLEPCKVIVETVVVDQVSKTPSAN